MLVGNVLRIVSDFRTGIIDVAGFWFNFKGKIIHIRYFAIRYNSMNYKSVIEMLQDITEGQK